MGCKNKLAASAPRQGRDQRSCSHSDFPEELQPVAHHICQRSPVVNPKRPCWFLAAFKAAVVSPSTVPGSSFSLLGNFCSSLQLREHRGLSSGKILTGATQAVTGEEGDKRACSGTVGNNKSGQSIQGQLTPAGKRQPQIHSGRINDT